MIGMTYDVWVSFEWYHPLTPWLVSHVEFGTIPNKIVSIRVIQLDAIKPIDGIIFKQRANIWARGVVNDRIIEATNDSAIAGSHPKLICGNIAIWIWFAEAHFDAENLTRLMR